jgi:crotonobetainyl-CoA:carnitine CoA-transferase CaiB-like acyl-CoA transferase
MKEKPFQELKIIDLSTVLAGPSVGTFFAELGARVIKIEHPIHGDVTNTWRLASEQDQLAQSAYYSSVNYGKELLKLDFQKAQDYARFLEELSDTDVVLMNFKKGDDTKLKLDPKTLWNHQPKLIIGKITGFGSENDRIAYDLILQAETGFMSMNGTPESGPTKMPVALIDVLAAHQLKEGLLLALLQRAKASKGQVVSVSLYDAAISSLANQASNYLMAQHVAQPIGSLHPNIAPYGEIFKTLDQKDITFAIGSHAHFEKLCQVLNLSAVLENPLYKENQLRVKNRFLLAKEIQNAVQERAAEELFNALVAIGVPVAIIKNMAEVFNDSAAQALVRAEAAQGQITKRVTQLAFQISDDPNA